MNGITAGVLVAALSLGLASAALADGDVPAVKEKSVRKKVREYGAGERMMPAPEVQLQRLAKGLKLTAEQQREIRPLLAEEYARLREIRQDESLSPKQIQEKVEALRSETVARIQALLTPEQKEKHEVISREIRANKQKRMQENRRARLGTQADPPEQGSR